MQVRTVETLTEQGLTEALIEEGFDVDRKDWQVVCGSFQGEARAYRILGTQYGVVRDTALATDEWGVRHPLEEVA